MMPGRILVLDDEENYAEMLQHLLQAHGYQVDMSTRPERAIERLQEIPYDLVISDYKMPILDGSDFLRKARELYPNLPFILVSGLMNTPELVKVANMRVTLVLEKPLDPNDFLEDVAKFVEAMTDEEKAQSERNSVAAKASINHKYRSYPEEPRFFSASSSISKRFIQDVWSASQVKGQVFILEPVGGDAPLVLKELSAWRGNLDKPIQSVNFGDLLVGGAEKLKALLSNDEASDVLRIQLSSSEQIAAAQAHLEKVVEPAQEALLVCVLCAEIPVAEFLQASGGAGFILPKLSRRPTDVAVYARRFARMHAHRLAKPNAAQFSDEATYAILAYEWPANFQQLQKVIEDAVTKNENAPLSLAVLGGLLNCEQAPAPELRLTHYVKQAQVNQLKDELIASSESFTMLAHRLELTAKIQSEEDLKDVPLLNPKLVSF